MLFNHYSLVHRPVGLQWRLISHWNWALFTIHWELVVCGCGGVTVKMTQSSFVNPTVSNEKQKR